MKEVNLLIVGKTGVGKSSTGNSILGEEKFETKMGSVAVTKQVQKETAIVQGHRVTVVDCPGLMDPELDDDEGLDYVINALVKALELSPDGYDAILIGTIFGQRLTKEDEKVFSRLKRIFGEVYIMKHGIQLVTHKDKYNKKQCNSLSLEEYLESETGLFKKMREGCGGRSIVLDNISDDPDVVKSLQKEVLDFGIEMKENGVSYTAEIFKQFQTEHDKLLLESQMPKIEKETDSKLNDIRKLLDEWHESCDRSSPDIGKLKDYEKYLWEIRESLKKVDKDTGALKKLISRVEGVETCVKRTVSSATDSSKKLPKVIIGEQKEALVALNRECEVRELVYGTILVAAAVCVVVGVVCLCMPSATPAVTKVAAKKTLSYTARRTMTKCITVSAARATVRHTSKK